ncbi:hypothetical protein EZV62_014488 [Acer yangbiense]|uniref:Uncharacterized protein n=1 Tax=Acer yangbiense TaxID=1000413 RepID=A0A5C7HSZ9_9ROSI|nr:hypothetical protein EZV62_014488 [Acer yangbiense]
MNTHELQFRRSKDKARVLTTIVDIIMFSEFTGRYVRDGSMEVSGFEPRKSSSSPLEREEYRPAAPLVRRYSISAASVSPHSSDVSKQALATKVQRLKDKVKLAKEDYLELRQEVNDLQEYCNAELD